LNKKCQFGLFLFDYVSPAHAASVRLMLLNYSIWKEKKTQSPSPLSQGVNPLYGEASGCRLLPAQPAACPGTGRDAGSQAHALLTRERWGRRDPFSPWSPTSKAWQPPSAPAHRAAAEGEKRATCRWHQSQTDPGGRQHPKESSTNGQSRVEARPRRNPWPRSEPARTPELIPRWRQMFFLTLRREETSASHRVRWAAPSRRWKFWMRY